MSESEDSEDGRVKALPTLADVGAFGDVAGEERAIMNESAVSSLECVMPIELAEMLGLDDDNKRPSISLNCRYRKFVLTVVVVMKLGCDVGCRAVVSRWWGWPARRSQRVEGESTNRENKNG